MKTRTAILSLVVFLIFPAYIWAEWYPGIIHAHSTFSDGDRTPEQLVSRAKGAATRFLVVTDHYEQIDNIIYQCGGPLTLKRGAALSLPPGMAELPLTPELLALVYQNFHEYGFSNYRSRFSAQTSSDFVVIPGAEICTRWAADSRDPAASHTLALGDAAFKDAELFELQCKADTQQAVTDRLNIKELNLLPVAAHPSLVASKYQQWISQISNLQFNPMGVKGIKGFEFFNDESAEGYQQTLDWYLRLLRQGNDVFVTSGCDSHDSTLDPDDSKRWARKTWVFSEKLEAGSLLEAMGQGRTYAAQYGALFGYINYIPGFQAQEVDRAKFVFWVLFEKKTSSPKTIRIYRDGELVPGSVQEYPKGLHRIDYAWEDKVVEGEHQYTVEVEGVLITSPIRLKIKTQPLPIAGPVPPIPNGINIGGISIGVVNFVREPEKVRVWLVFRRINENSFPRGFSLRITDDRGNEYSAWYEHISRAVLEAAPMPGVWAVKTPKHDYWIKGSDKIPFVNLTGFTWIPNSPLEIRIPEIAPISKFEMVLDPAAIPSELRGTIPEKFTFDYRKLAPFSGLDFKIKPEQVLIGRKIEISEHLSMWLVEPKVLEKVGQKDVKKTIVVSIPMTVENQDYNPRSIKEHFEFWVQLSSGRVIGPAPSGWLQVGYSLGESIEAVTKKTFEISFSIDAEKKEHIQIVLVNKRSGFWGLFLLSDTYDTEVYIYPDEDPNPTEWLITRKTVCYSSDKGKTWDTLLTLENMPSLSWHLIDFVRVLDRQNIVIEMGGFGATGTIETNDGGKTWEFIVYGGRHYGSKHGKLRTQDGGKTWQEIDVLYK